MTRVKSFTSVVSVAETVQEANHRIDWRDVMLFSGFRYLALRVDQNSVVLMKFGLNFIIIEDLEVAVVVVDVVVAAVVIVAVKFVSLSCGCLMMFYI